MTVSNKTYNNVVNTLCNLGNNHLQIGAISVGDIYDINLAKMEKFPLMHINPVNVETGQSQLTYNFQIFIMDRVTKKEDWESQQQSVLRKLIKTESNEQDVWNQTLSISTDIISMLRHSLQASLFSVSNINDMLYHTEGEFVLEPFQERFDNMLCGWVFYVGIMTKNNFDACTIPVTSLGSGF